MLQQRTAGNASASAGCAAYRRDGFLDDNRCHRYS